MPDRERLGPIHPDISLAAGGLCHHRMVHRRAALAAQLARLYSSATQCVMWSFVGPQEARFSSFVRPHVILS